jgi:tetratricopeptide (TPR) repeat protein
MSTATRTDAAAGAPAFQAGYVVRDVAKLLGLTQHQIHAYIRSDCLAPRRGENNEFRFSFQDLVLLRAAKVLTKTLPPRKVYRALRLLRDQLPRGRAITGVRLTAEGDTVVVRDGSIAWEPESGQALLDFDVSAFAAKVEPLARRSAAEAEESEDTLDAEDWYRHGCDMEPFDGDQSRRAYARALDADPAHFDARLNLGRLIHESGDVAGAEAHYRRALDRRPDDPTALYNLGVALEDRSRPRDARTAYLKAIAADPRYADAHFNLSNLFERLGDFQSALKHLQIYRRLQTHR